MLSPLVELVRLVGLYLLGLGGCLRLTWGVDHPDGWICLVFWGEQLVGCYWSLLALQVFNHNFLGMLPLLLDDLIVL